MKKLHLNLLSRFGKNDLKYKNHFWKVTKLNGIVITTLILSNSLIQISNVKEVKPISGKAFKMNTISYVADLSTVFPNFERAWNVRCDIDGR